MLEARASSLELEAHAGLLELEAAQLMAAKAAALLSRTRGPAAYAAAANICEANALARGVCVQIRA
jgi:hypothetical protein